MLVCLTILPVNPPEFLTRVVPLPGLNAGTFVVCIVLVMFVISGVLGLTIIRFTLRFVV